MRKFFIIFSLLLLSFLFIPSVYAIHEVNHNYFITIGRNDPVTFDTGLDAYAVLSDEFIGKGGKCSATLFEKEIEEKRLTGPTEEGVCKYFVSGSEFELFGLTKEHTGKNVPFSFIYFPPGCESTSCADAINSSFLLGLLSSEEPTKPTEPIQCENDVTIFDIEVEPDPILDCEKFVSKPILSSGFPCGFCEARINGEAPRIVSYFDNPGNLNGGGCSGVEIFPDEFSRFGVRAGEIVTIKWLYFPQGCGSEACAKILEREVKVAPCEDKIVSSGELSSLIEELDFIREDLISEFQQTRIRPIKIVANKINRVINLLEEASISSEKGDVDSCDETLSHVGRVLDSAITQFESRQCRFRSNRRCIPTDIIEAYIGDLEAILDSVDKIQSTDDDDDGLPDVCGF